MVAINQNKKAFDLHFKLNRAVLLKWQPELILNRLKIKYLKMKHMVIWTACTSPVCAE